MVGERERERERGRERERDREREREAEREMAWVYSAYTIPHCPHLYSQN